MSNTICINLTKITDFVKLRGKRGCHRHLTVLCSTCLTDDESWSKAPLIHLLVDIQLILILKDWLRREKKEKTKQRVGGKYLQSDWLLERDGFLYITGM